MADFIRAYERVLAEEGGYKLTNDKRDKGGQTYAGIARRSNPNWPGWAMIDNDETPPAEMVRALYRWQYWDKISGDHIESQAVAEAIYTAFVNMGSPAVKLAQIVAGVTPDGKIGPSTLEALRRIDADRFLDRYCIAMVTRYRDIVSKDKTQRVFLLGWINRALKVAA